MGIGAIGAIGAQPSAFIYQPSAPTMRQEQPAPLQALTGAVRATQQAQGQGGDSLFLFQGNLTVSPVSLENSSLAAISGVPREKASALAAALGQLSGEQRSSLPGFVPVTAGNIDAVTTAVQRGPAAVAAIPGAQRGTQGVGSGLLLDITG